MDKSWGEGTLDVPVLVAGTPEDYEVHLAAVEFSLANAIIIRDADDIQSTKHWSERLGPFEHQIRNLITFCRRAPVALIADDVGMGKTISAGLVMSELFTRRKISRSLVVCPKILLPQWQSELKEKFGIDAVCETGQAIHGALRGNTRVVITTYHTVRDHIDGIRGADFGMLVLDEAHKLKSLFGYPTPARMAVAVRDALADSVFRYVLMLTATPIQTSPWDLYSLIDCLSVARHHAHPLGTPEQFQSYYLNSSSRRRPSLRPNRVPEFRRVLSQYIVRTSRQAANLPFPGRHVILRKTTDVGADHAAQRLLSACIESIPGPNKINVAVAMMSSNAAFAKQLSNMSETRPLLRPFAKAAQELADREPLGPKFAELRRIVEKLRADNQDFRLVVFTTRLETQTALQRAIEAMGVRTGLIRGGDANANSRTVLNAQEEPPKVNAIISTDAGAEGINLQVANVVVNYDLPWNPMVIEQRIGRVQRLGSHFEMVQVFNLVVAGSIEERIVGRLLHRLQDISRALGDLEAILEAAGFGDDDNQGFTDELRKLVLDALHETNVDAHLSRIEENIAQAKRLYEQERDFVEEALGSDLDAMHTAGPTMPDIGPVQPRMSVREFVRAAYEANGGLVEEDASGRLRIDPPGERRFTATFDEHDPSLRVVGSFAGLAGANVRWFDVGSPHFERLVGEWASTGMHVTLDARLDSQSDPLDAAVAWIEGLGDGFAYDTADVLERRPSFAGTISVQATVGVAHDRLERIVEASIGECVTVTARQGMEAGATPYQNNLALRDEPSFDPDCLKRIVEDQADLTSFALFYRTRRDEETARAKSDRSRQVLAERQFTPQFAMKVQAASGTLAETIKARVRYTLDGRGPYEDLLELAPGRVIAAPEVRQCAATNRLVPQGALGRCALSGVEAVKHALVTSQKSHRTALPEYGFTCEVTGMLLLDDELDTCAMTGTRADVDLFGKCAVSGTSVLTERLIRCDFTDAQIRDDLAETSQVSGRRFRSDEAQESAVSGVRGHRSEFITCAESHAAILPSESGQSAISGKTVRRELLLESQKTPGRFALRRETAVCAVTGRRLLENELRPSAVSGKLADPDSMVRSDKSGQLAMPGELVICEVSGALLLPAETDVCHVTKKRVDAALLAVNDLTHQRTLLSSMQRCPETGHLALPSELERCEKSGYLVDPAVLSTCWQSGQRVLTRYTVLCDECHNPVLLELATETSDGLHAHQQCTAPSQWSGGVHLVSQLSKCKLTGIHVTRAEIADEGVAKPILMVDARVRRQDRPDGAIPLEVREAMDAANVRLGEVWILRSDTTDLCALVGRRKRWFGLSRQHVLAFVNLVDRRVVGDVFEA